MVPNRNRQIPGLAPNLDHLPMAITSPICPTRPSSAPSGFSGSGASGGDQIFRPGVAHVEDSACVQLQIRGYEKL